MLSAFFWWRFIKTRIPQEIPFELSLWSFSLLLSLCLFYTYSCYKILKPSSTSNILISYILLKIKPIFTPLILLQEYIFNISNIKYLITHCIKGLISISNNIVYYDSLYKYLFCFILPQIIFTICLLCDCFYWHKLYMIYGCVFIITIPLVIRYLLYCMGIIQEETINVLDKDLLIEIISIDDSFMDRIMISMVLLKNILKLIYMSLVV